MTNVCTGVCFPVAVTAVGGGGGIIVYGSVTSGLEVFVSQHKLPPRSVPATCLSETPAPIGSAGSQSAVSSAVQGVGGGGGQGEGAIQILWLDVNEGRLCSESFDARPASHNTEGCKGRQRQ